MIGIYKITSPSNKIYIGQSWNIKKRFGTYSSGNCKRQCKLYNSFQKHGVKNHVFEEIEIYNENITQYYLDQKEIYWWLHYIDLGFEMLNIKEPGKGGKMAEESKQKISIANKGKKHFGRPVSLETRKKISIGNLGKIMSKEAIENMSKSKKGIACSEKHKHSLIMCKSKPLVMLDLNGNFVREWDRVSDASKFLGKKQNSNINAQLLGITKSCANYQFVLKENYNSNKDYKIGKGDTVAINQFTLDKVFIKTFMSFMDAERELGKKYANSAIHKCCNGKQKQAYGYIWEYKINNLK